MMELLAHFIPRIGELIDLRIAPLVHPETHLEGIPRSNCDRVCRKSRVKLRVEYRRRNADTAPNEFPFSRPFFKNGLDDLQVALLLHNLLRSFVIRFVANVCQVVPPDDDIRWRRDYVGNKRYALY